MSTEHILAIRSLTEQYIAAANRLDAKGMAAVYAEDGEIIALGNRFSGRAAIEKVFVETMGIMDVMNQICSGGVIDVEGNRATAHWSVAEFAKRQGADKLEIFIGDYQDELIFTAEGWRFTKRVLTSRLRGRFEGTVRV
jgi:ketosteroid isomerase-like protein